MMDAARLGKTLEDVLRLSTRIVAYKKLDRAEDLDQFQDVKRIARSFAFCQLPALVRFSGWTVGAAKADEMNARCKNLCGLEKATEDGIWVEAAVMATTWMPDHEQSLKQQADYPRMSTGEAIILAPLTEGRFDPDVVLIYADVAQIMMLLCGLQKRQYENFLFSFLGEGDCTNTLARCYSTGKISLGLGCYGERSMGQMADGEMILAMPPHELERAVLGLKDLGEIGFKLPIRIIGAGHDPFPELAEFYPPDRVGEAVGRAMASRKK